MNKYFDEARVEEYFPEAGPYMFPPMLISHIPAGKEAKLPEICENGEYFLQEKIDGALYMFVKTENHSYMFSRTVSRVSGLLVDKSANFAPIVEALAAVPPGTVIIGEVYIPGGTAKDVVSVSGCLPKLALKKQETIDVRYYLHDIVYCKEINLMDESAETRYETLKTMWDYYNLGQSPKLRLAEVVTEDLEAEISRILKSGGEGVVLKRRNGSYSPGKRPAWVCIKVKQMDNIDLICCGFCNPTKLYTGKELDTWQYWAYTKDGEEHTVYGVKPPDIEDAIPVTKPYALGWKSAIEIGAYDEEGNIRKLGTVSSGLTDELRSAFALNPEDYLNRVVTLDCMSIDRKAMTLRHPIFKGFRDDKNASDCTLKEAFS